jgi:xylose isomerase
VCAASERYQNLVDNYRLWDDDMIVGSVHTIEYLDLLYWLDRVGYDGNLSLDQCPYREEPEEAITESVLWLQAMCTLVERMGMIASPR